MIKTQGLNDFIQLPRLMPRSGRLRNFIREFSESPGVEKLSFIPPFLIVIVELILLVHASVQNPIDPIVMELTTILVIISVVEITLVMREIHEHRQTSNFERILTIKLDDFILKKRNNNVRKIVEDFIDAHVFLS
jgi:membrane protein required for beta-lactamase induction